MPRKVADEPESPPASVSRAKARARSKTPVRNVADTPSKRSKTPSKKQPAKPSEEPAPAAAAPVAAPAPVPEPVAEVAPAPVEQALPAAPEAAAEASRIAGELSITSPAAQAPAAAAFVPPAYNPNEMLVFVGVLAAIAWASYEQAFAGHGFLKPWLLGLLQLVPSFLITYITLSTMRGKRVETNFGSLVVLYFYGMMVHCAVEAAKSTGLLTYFGKEETITGQYVDLASFAVLAWAIYTHEHPQFGSKTLTAALAASWFALHFIVAGAGIAAASVKGQPEGEFWGAGKYALNAVYTPSSYSLYEVLDKVLPLTSVLIAATAGARAICAWQAGSVARYHLAAVAFAVMFVPGSPVVSYLLWPVAHAAGIREVVFREVAAWTSMYLLGASSI